MQQETKYGACNNGGLWERNTCNLTISFLIPFRFVITRVQSHYITLLRSPPWISSSSQTAQKKLFPRIIFGANLLFLNGICPIVDFRCVSTSTIPSISHRHRPSVFRLGDAIHLLFELGKSTSTTLRFLKLVWSSAFVIYALQVSFWCSIAVLLAPNDSNVVIDFRFVRKSDIIISPQQAWTSKWKPTYITAGFCLAMNEVSPTRLPNRSFSLQSGPSSTAMIFTPLLITPQAIGYRLSLTNCFHVRSTSDTGKHLIKKISSDDNRLSGKKYRISARFPLWR